MCEYLPPQWLAFFRYLLGIHGNHDTLRAKSLRRLAHKLGIGDRRRIDSNLVCPRVKHCANVFQGANATTDGQGNKHLTGDSLDRVYGGLSSLVTGSDIQKGNLVGSGITVALGYLHRITRVADIEKLNALYDASILAIQTGNYSLS